MSSAQETSLTALRPASWARLILPTVLALLGLLILVLTPGQVVDSATDPVGPKFLPYVTGLVILLGGVADFIMQWLKRTPAASISEQEASEAPVSRKTRLISYALILVAILVWVYTTVLLGYALSSFILMALTGAAFGLKKPIKMFVLIVVTVGITYFVFAELLQVQLPLIGW